MEYPEQNRDAQENEGLLKALKKIEEELVFGKGGVPAFLEEKKVHKLTDARLLALGFKEATGDAVWENCSLSDFDRVFWIPGMYFLESNSNGSYDFYFATDEDTYTQLRTQLRYEHQLQALIFGLTEKHLPI